MIFEPQAIAGVFLLVPEPRPDDRGFFARTFCQEEFERAGLKFPVVQCSTSFNLRTGTLRGMHYTSPESSEAKLVRCTRGRALDVVLDLRSSSPTYRRWISAELNDENRHALYIPHGCAHGFQTLADDTEIFYQMNEAYRPEHARAVRWNDPAFGIRWPIADPILSERDAALPDFKKDAE